MNKTDINPCPGHICLHSSGRRGENINIHYHKWCSLLEGTELWKIRKQKQGRGHWEDPVQFCSYWTTSHTILKQIPDVISFHQYTFQCASLLVSGLHPFGTRDWSEVELGRCCRHRRSFTCQPAARLLLCGPAPNRPRAGTGRQHGGWGPPL